MLRAAGLSNTNRDIAEDLAKTTATSPCIFTCAAMPIGAKEEQQASTHSPPAGTASGSAPLADLHGSAKSASCCQFSSSGKTGMIPWGCSLLPVVNACNCICIGLTVFVVFAYTCCYTVEQSLDCLASPEFRNSGTSHLCTSERRVCSREVQSTLSSCAAPPQQLVNT